MENCMHMNSRSYFKAKRRTIYCLLMRERVGVGHCMAYVLLNLAVSRYD